MAPRKIKLLEAVDARIREVFHPYVVADVNESQVKIAKFGPEFDWHSHPAEDEAFLVLRGRIAIDFRDGPVELGEGEFLLVPKGIEHRPRALTREPVALMFELATTLNTGDAASNFTISELERL